MEPMRRTLPFLILLLMQVASADGLTAYLRPLVDHPGLAAAAAQVISARAAVSVAREPFSVTLAAGTSRASINDEAVSQLPPMPGAPLPPTQASQFSADLVFRPIPFGDIADLVGQRQVQLEQAELEWREALTALQVQALEAAYSLHIAGDGVALAEEAALIAHAALAATELRASRGVATESEVRDALLAVTEADNLVLTARSGLRLAGLAVKSLVGDAAVPAREQLWLSVPDLEPASVKRAELTARLAAIGSRNARRSLLPVAHAGYTHFVDDHNTIELSIETRTLQPNMRYSHQSTARPYPENLADGIFQVGVSATIPVSIVSQIEAADAQEAAGLAAVESTRITAMIQHESLRHELAEADASLEIADLAFRNARLSLQEAQTREELGLGVPLETMHASLSVARAGLELQQARLAQFSATLGFHSFNAQPIVEVASP